MCFLAVRAWSSSDETLKPAQASSLTGFSRGPQVLILSELLVS